jgi:uncharacterized membrane protein
LWQTLNLILTKVKTKKLELLIKVIVWRALSMSCGFVIAYIFTGKLAESAGITIIIGPTLALVQWCFEIFWDKHIRENLRNVISRQQGRINWLLWWRRGTCTVSVDKHKPGPDRRQEEQNPLSPKNAGRGWT